MKEGLSLCLLILFTCTYLYLYLESCEIKINQNSETSQQMLKEERHASTEIERQVTDKEIRIMETSP